MEKDTGYNQLWGYFLGNYPQDNIGETNSRFAKRIGQCRDGYMPYGKSYAKLSEGFKDIIGPLAPRLLLATDPESLNLLPEQLAACGGWCALRTADVQLMSNEASIMNPDSGYIEPVRSVIQFTDWIRRSPTFDQIIESVGPVNAGEYAAISEGRLWAERAITKLATILRRNLSPEERSAIESAIYDAENTREELTRRYLSALLQNDNLTFRRVNDYDIWDELKKARDKLLQTAGISLEHLSAQDPTAPNASIVWGMYSEPYFDVLRGSGIITSSKVLIVEPAFHAYPETRAHRQVADRIYPGNNRYFSRRGLNANTGFVAFIECLDEKGFNVRRTKPAGLVPNIANWESLFEKGNQFDPGSDSNLAINPALNALFQWGLNLYPTDDVLSALFRLSDIQRDYKKAKLNYSGDQQAIIDLKKAAMETIYSQNTIIAAKLQGLFRYMTEGLTI